MSSRLRDWGGAGSAPVSPLAQTFPPDLPMTVEPISHEEASHSGMQIAQVTQRQLLVQANGTLVYGNDVSVSRFEGYESDGVTPQVGQQLLYIRSELTMWHRIRTSIPGDSGKYLFTFGTPALIATMDGGELTGIDFTPVTIPISCTLPLLIIKPSDGSFIQGRAMAVVPGTSKTTGSKLGTVQGASGYTAIATPGAVLTGGSYMLFTVLRPQGTNGTTANSQMTDPMYLAFVSAGTTYILGDITPFLGSGTQSWINIAVATTLPVTSVGCYFFGTETGTGAATAYSRWDVSIRDIAVATEPPVGASLLQAATISGGTALSGASRSNNPVVSNAVAIA